jgi:NADPH-dependent 2,4-dienoyl-CoA reductase/sulfur reductase-like enzyme
MRVLVVGNGIAAIMFAKSLRESGIEANIDIYAKEKYHYYPRPNLIDFLADRIPFERVFAFPEDWYAKNKLNVHLRSPAVAVHPDAQDIELANEQKEKYDKLFLANGSHSFIPPFKGTDKRAYLLFGQSMMPTISLGTCLITPMSRLSVGGSSDSKLHVLSGIVELMSRLLSFSTDCFLDSWTLKEHLFFKNRSR